MVLLDRPSWQLAILSGILVGISYLPFKLGFFIYFGFIPILHAWILNNAKSNFISGLVFGITYNLISNYLSDETKLQVEKLLIYPKLFSIYNYDNFEVRKIKLLNSYIKTDIKKITLLVRRIDTVQQKSLQD